jgi:hypothetical protein
MFQDLRESGGVDAPQRRRRIRWGRFGRCVRIESYS